MQTGTLAACHAGYITAACCLSLCDFSGNLPLCSKQCFKVMDILQLPCEHGVPTRDSSFFITSVCCLAKDTFGWITWLSLYFSLLHFCSFRDSLLCEKAAVLSCLAGLFARFHQQFTVEGLLKDHRYLIQSHIFFHMMRWTFEWVYRSPHGRHLWLLNNLQLNLFLMLFWLWFHRPNTSCNV